MKIGVVGAGIQGSACVKILTKSADAESITVLDNRFDRLNSVMRENPSPKITCRVCDIKDIAHAKALLDGCDVIFDMLIPEFTEYTMRVALDLKADYINTAYDNPFWKCIIEGKEFPFDREFKNAGLIAMLGCGDSPGFVNVFVKKYCDYFDRIDSVRIFGAYKNHKTYDGGNWNPGWSRKQAYLDFITPPVVFKDGKYVQKEQFSDIETVSFPNYGDRRLALHSHEEVYSVPRIIGKQIKNCEFKYEIDPYAYRMFHDGYTENTYITDNGVEKCVLNGLFEKFDAMKDDLSDDGDEYTSIIQICGYTKGKPESLNAVLPPLYRDRNLAKKLFGTTKIDVALLAIVFMRCMSSLTPGIHFAEEINPELFQKRLHEYIPYTDESILK